MEKVARVLRQVREQRGLSLEEAAKRTRISPAYLALLEGQIPNGKRQETLLSDPLYLIPHLRHYADFLDIDPNFAVVQFTEELQAAQGKSTKNTTTAQSTQLLSSSPQRSRAISISIVLASVLVTLAFIGLYSDVKGRTPGSANNSALPLPEPPSGANPQPTPTLPLTTETTPRAPGASQHDSSSPVVVAQPSLPPLSGTAQHSSPPPNSTAPALTPAAQSEKNVTPTPQPEASPSVPTTLAQQSARTSSHFLRVHAKEATWIRIFAEGQAKEMILRPGQSAAWSSESPFELTIGNAGGITLNLDGQELPPLGKSGQVIRNMHLPFPPTESQG